MLTSVRKVQRPDAPQVPLAQSLPTVQLWQSAQLAQLPPQSTSVSVPLRTRSSQRAGWQAPPVQTPVAQVPPQRPQWATLVERSTSQPLAAFPSQSPKPGLQVKPQVPLPQVALAWAGAAHARPHAPQCEVLVRVSTSQPLLALPSQSPKPAAQAVSPHTPDSQAALALLSEQRCPQRPQCVLLVRRLVSQPLDSTRSQSSKPTAQVRRQVDPTHAGTLLAGAGHARAHAPQCEVLVRVSTSQPLLALPSQSP